MAATGKYRRYVMFRGLVNDFDDEYNEVDMAELDARAYGCTSNLDRIEPNRDPQLEVDYLGVAGNVELLYNFKTTWMDRDSDIMDYLDEVQVEIENDLDIIISEREMLGVKEI